jgi:hypothetical protein
MDKSQIDLHNFAKENYFHEIDRKDKITSRISQTTTTLTILLGLVGISTKEIQYPFSNFEYIQLAALIVSIFYISKIIFYLMKFFIGFKYKYIAPSSIILKYYNDLVKYNSVDGKDNPDLLLIDYLIKSYTDTTNINIKNNDKKSEYIYIANENIVKSLPSILSLGLLYLIQNILN